MPYIKQGDRARLANDPFDVRTAGELNYQFTKLIQAYILREKVSYQAFNDCIGALEGCKLELYRRKVGDYENLKIQENSDVW